MAKQNNIIHIKEIIKNSINNKEFKENFKILLLKKQWNEIIGEKLYYHTAPQKILKNILYVKCAHQGWIQTLFFYKNDILKNIEKFYQYELNIKDIIFIFGSIKQNDMIPKTKKIIKESESKIEIKNDNIQDLLTEFFKKRGNKSDF